MKNKVLVGSAIVILIGIIVIVTLGFNVDFSYKNYTLVDIKIGKDFNINDIKSITDEVFSKQNVEIQVAGTYSDSVVIKVNEITDEQKESLNNKINEKFGIENNIDDIEINKIPSYRLRDIAKSYAVPLIITTVLILVYMAIRFRKIGFKNIVCQTLLLTVMAELLYGSIIAITRYPINRLVLPVAVVIYVAVITVLTGMFEKQLNAEEK